MGPRQQHITWLSIFLTDVHPFKANVSAITPLFWSAILYVVSSIPLWWVDQTSLAFSRPFVVCFGGVFCELTIAYIVILIYRHMLIDLPLAIDDSQQQNCQDIVEASLQLLNSKWQFLCCFIAFLIPGCCVVFFSYLHHADQHHYVVFYFLGPEWYGSEATEGARLFALFLMTFFTVLFFSTGVWFQIWHWRMFHRLLRIKLSSSPILIYQGFSKLWWITNISSVAMLSSNLFLLFLVHFRPHPVQLLAGALVTFPGVTGVLSPTYLLFRSLILNKEVRTAQLLGAGQAAYKNLNPQERILAFANLYNSLFVERNVGNTQATVSLSIAVISLVIAAIQIAGLDGNLRALIALAS